MAAKGDQRVGLLNGIAAYGMWGLVPLFWPLVDSAGAVEILAHRMVWSLVLVAAALLVTRRWAWAGALLRQPRRLGLVAVAAATITVNWGVYIWAVNSGHVVEASLGYFINPLVTIAMGVLLLKERLRPAQWVAVGMGVASVITLTFGYGRPPWISLCLAFSFATYGLAKKKVALSGMESLAAETVIQFLPALGYLLWLGARGEGTFTTEGAGHAALLASAGLVTAVPLVCFGASAIRVPLSTLGLLQYLTPVLQFLLGVLYFHEEMPAERWMGFALVWVALTVLTWDALRTARRNRAEAMRLRTAAPTAAPTNTATTAPTATASAEASAGAGSGLDRSAAPIGTDAACGGAGTVDSDPAGSVPAGPDAAHPHADSPGANSPGAAGPDFVDSGAAGAGSAASGPAGAGASACAEDAAARTRGEQGC